MSQPTAPSDHNQPCALLGGISINTFMTEYWQKKPLLVRAAMPTAIDLILPDDLIELALSHIDPDGDVTPEDETYGEALPTLSTRLISQHGDNNEQWQVNTKPLQPTDFDHLPKLWTLLVQAVDHWSSEVNALWQNFNFIPGWRRDDIMVSYAPAGGSVGKHFDYYDVFLVQSHGHRRWQLGQMCDANTLLVANQPLKLLPDIDVCFDEIVGPGDLLYVPPGMAHYGVAQNDCTTLSFGFRMPSSHSMSVQVLETLLSGEQANSIPFADTRPQGNSSQTGLVSAADLAFLQHSWLQSLGDNSSALANITMALLSSSKFDDVLGEQYSIPELQHLLQNGTSLIKEPRVRLLYSQSAAGVNFWSQSLEIDYPPSCLETLIKLADCQCMGYADINATQAWDFWLALLAQGIVSLEE